jgi:hypothetical protein
MQSLLPRLFFRRLLLLLRVAKGRRRRTRGIFRRRGRQRDLEPLPLDDLDDRNKFGNRRERGFDRFWSVRSWLRGGRNSVEERGTGDGAFRQGGRGRRRRREGMEDQRS